MKQKGKIRIISNAIICSGLPRYVELHNHYCYQYNCPVTNKFIVLFIYK